jgi:hypothetical protein
MAPGESGTPGHRSGNGADSSREQMQRDEQRRKNPESGRPDPQRPAPQTLPEPVRSPAK